MKWLQNLAAKVVLLQASGATRISDKSIFRVLLELEELVMKGHKRYIVCSQCSVHLNLL